MQLVIILLAIFLQACSSNRQNIHFQEQKMTKVFHRAVEEKQHVVNKQQMENDYSALLAKYEANDRVGFDLKMKDFLLNYPHSPFEDNLLYLQGMMHFYNQQFGSALSSLNQILKQHPHSKKYVAALYAKGVVMKRMNLIEESKNMFRQVQLRFPHSPEAARAEGEMKLLRE